MCIKICAFVHSFLPCIYIDFFILLPCKLSAGKQFRLYNPSALSRKHNHYLSIAKYPNKVTINKSSVFNKYLCVLVKFTSVQFIIHSFLFIMNVLFKVE